MFETDSRSTSMRYFFAETKSLKSQRPVTQDLKKSIWQRYSNLNILALTHAEHILKVNSKLVAIPPYAEHTRKLVTLWLTIHENWPLS